VLKLQLKKGQPMWQPLTLSVFRELALSVENMTPAAGAQKAAAVNKSDSSPRFISDSHIRVALRDVTGEIAAQNPGHEVLDSGRLLGVGRPKKAPFGCCVTL
jgi:hypothetical protein